MDVRHIKPIQFRNIRVLSVATLPYSGH